MRARGWLAALALACTLVANAAGGSEHEAPSRVLNLYSWSEYFPEAVIRRFEAETGIKVNYSVFDSNDVAETTLIAGRSGFDLVTVNASPHLGRQIPKGLWRPLDVSSIHNYANIDPKLLEMLRHVDPGNRYAIPYMWGTIGIIYNPDLVRAHMPNAPVDSLDMVFRPDVVSRLRGCGISILSSWIDVLPLLSIYVGQRDLSIDPRALEQLAVAFARVRPAIRRITTSGYYDQLARGELCVSLGYSADAMVAVRHAAEQHTNIRIAFSAPREAVPVYIDAYAIPASARHADAALRFIDFTLRPEIGAALAHATGFAVANAAAVRLLEPGLRDNPMVYPSEDVRRRLFLDRGYSMEETRMLSRTWLRMKTGY
jgi:putrescine transport system substrate-binding protein